MKSEVFDAQDERVLTEYYISAEEEVFLICLSHFNFKKLLSFCFIPTTSCFRICFRREVGSAVSSSVEVTASLY